MPEFKLRIWDNGDEVLAEHEFSEEWSGEGEPAGSMLAGAILLKFLDDVLEFQAQDVEKPVD